VFAHLVVVALVFVLVLRRLGQWLGLGAALVILFLGSAWEDLLLPIQVSFVGSMAAGLAMLVVLDTQTGRRRDVLCSALLLLSIACSSVGLSFAVVALVEILVAPGRLRRSWVVAAPLVAYAAWQVGYGERELEEGGGLTTNLPWVPSYVADEVAGALGALTGLGIDWGRVLAVGAAGVIVWRLVGRDRVSVRLLALAAGAFSFWIATALARAHLDDPAATRYLYVGAVYALLIAAELWRPRRLSRRAAALVGLGVVFVVVANLALLRGGRDTLREFSDEISARLAALELAGDSAPADFRPAWSLAPAIVAGPYLATVAEHGSPAAPRESLASMPEAARRAADDVLIEALVRARPGAPRVETAQAPEVDRAVGGRVVASGACVRLVPRTGDAELDLAVASEGLRIHVMGATPARLALRRFAEGFSEKTFSVAPSRIAVVSLPRRDSDAPWRARIVTSGEVEACGAEVGQRRSA
jgi:hypothetical protein